MKRRRLTRLALGLSTFASTLAVGVAVATGAPGVSPQTVDLQLNPGESATIAKSVETAKLPPKSDFVFLADNTGSMSPSLDDVKANSQSIIDAIEAAGATDARYGVGNYRDFTSTGPCNYGFHLDSDLTDAAAAKAAINTWSASGGCDIPEAGFFGLHRVAVHDITWRPSSTRFVIWFGDAPSHDPICSALPGYSDPHSPITEASVTADLVGQGIRVIAASALSGQGLDADPKPDSVSYAGLCGPEAGNPGQALRITTATGGADLVNPPATSISATIIAALNAIPPIPVVVTPVPTCDLGLTATNVPPTQTVPSGSTATFTETVSVLPSAAPGSTLHCTVDYTINGASAGPAYVQTITVKVGVGFPTKLVLSPKTATNPPDAQHCVTATVTDAFGTPVAGVVVDFTVAGSDIRAGSGTTDATGVAQFCYTVASLPGADTITATARTGTHPTDTATKTISTPVGTPGCKIDQEGKIRAANGDKATFAGHVVATATGGTGRETYADLGPAVKFSFLSTSIDAVVCAGNSATIFGRGKVVTKTGTTLVQFRIDKKDLCTSKEDDNGNDDNGGDNGGDDNGNNNGGGDNGGNGSGDDGKSRKLQNGKPKPPPCTAQDRYRIRLSNGYDSGDQPILSGDISIRP